ncbi:hypothetical protein AA0112_g10335 [Alternaria arborescens]|uniref:hypothetical protein n=1 Tax=Alternaria arborescens TaxID=156630 RepID=UPI001074CE86|nr:hypothetical protein AA0111_g4566 [Alternaria arborescens]RYN21317.1 hypothetical protein AA0112_g10335 [Alternaria arborescens]RYO32765.1 hypothetical protein AA0111_g4566 [Alternaria arborescens]
MASFNSDDLQFSDPEVESPLRNPRLGNKSLEQIKLHADADRISSKRTVKQLTFQHGPTVSRVAQTLWIRRLETWREAVGQDVRKPFTGDDLIRFMDVIIPKMVVVEGKPGPNRNTIISATKLIMAYGHFKWSEQDGFRMTAHDTSRFRSFLDKATRDGRLTTGKWKKRTWIGYAVLSRLVRAYLTHGIEQGTSNWDVTMARCLSVVLVSSLGARCGDVGLAAGYKGKAYYMQWRHIELFLEGDVPLFSALRVRITLEFEKGNKETHNEETIRYLRPLNDTANSHMCPVALLLVHALRHSLVAGNTLGEVLNLAVKRSDRAVVWLFPNRPVLPKFVSAPFCHCDLDQPAMTTQISLTIAKMGFVAGMLDRAHGHALRLGAARDAAHLPASVVDGSGLATENVRQSLGHKHATLQSGTTDRYVGGASSEMWNLRAQMPYEPKGRESRFASSSSNHTGPEARGRTTQMLADPSPLPLLRASRQPLAKRDSNVWSAPTMASSSGSDDIDPALIDPALMDEAQVDAAALAVSETAVQALQTRLLLTHGSEEALTADAVVVIDNDDTNLQLHRFGAAEADAAASTAASDNTSEDANIFFDELDHREAMDTVSMSSPEAFIEGYAKYNIVTNCVYGRECAKAPSGKPSDEVIAQFCVVGGSRDAPEPMLYRCKKTPGCPVASPSKSACKDHEEYCSDTKVQQFAEGADKLESDFKCTYNGCDFVPSPFSKRPRYVLMDHVRSVHKFDPKACPHGCAPETLYYTDAKYKYHLAHAHSDRWPARCTYPGCNHPRPFATHSSLTHHLKRTHLLSDEDMLLYMPPLPATRQYVEQTCWMNGCDRIFNSKNVHIKHLRKAHKCSLEEAHQLMEENAEFEMITPTVAVRSKRPVTTKDLQKVKKARTSSTST